MAVGQPPIKGNTHLSRPLRLLAVAVFIFGGVFFAVRELVLQLDHQTALFARWANHLLPQSVHLSDARVTWSGFTPEITLKNVAITSEKGSPISAQFQRVQLRVSLWHSLLHFRWVPSQLIIRKGYVKADLPQWPTSQNAKSPPWVETVQRELAEMDVRVEDVSLYLSTPKKLRLTVKHMALQFSPHGASHRLAGSFTFQQDKQSIPVKFVAATSGLPMQAGRDAAQIYVNVQNVSLSDRGLLQSWLARYVHNASISKGVLQGAFWLTVRDGQLQKIQSQLSVNDLQLDTPLLHTKGQQVASSPARVPTFSANVLWAREAQGWLIKADHVKLVTSNHVWQTTKFGYRFVQNAGTRAQYFAVRYLHLQDAHEIAEKLGLLTKENDKTLHALAPKGILREVVFAVRRASGKKPVLACRVNFSHFTFSPSGQMPGAKNLSGTLSVSPQGGALKLSSADTIFSWPSGLTQSLTVNTLKSDLRWVRTQNGVHLTESNGLISDGNVSLRGDFTLDLPKLGSPQIAMASTFQVKDLAKIKPYLPTKMLSPGLSSWLRQAFQAGQITRGQWVWRGPLRTFPYRQHAGQFEVLANIRHATLRYHPDWPALSDMQATVRFHDAGMEVNALQANLAGNTLKPIVATIANLQHPILRVRGEGDIQLPRAFSFLEATPLSVAKSLSDLKPSGAAHVRVSLEGPLQGKDTLLQTRGTLTLQQDTLRLPSWGLQFSRLTGPLQFTNDTLHTQAITGNFFGKPLTFSVQTVKQKQGTSLLQIMSAARLNIDDLSRRYLPVLHRYAVGTSDVQALLQIPSVSTAPITLSLMSDLSGISIGRVPAMLQKSPQSTVSTQVSVRFAPHKPVAVSLSYARRLSAALHFSHQQGALTFENGEVVLGDAKAQFQDEPGLVLRGVFRRFDWADWKPYLMPFWDKSGDASHAGLSIRQIGLSAQQVIAFGRTFEQIHTHLAPKPKAWVVSIDSPLAQGQLQIPTHAKRPWWGEFTRLYLPKTNSKEKKNLRLNQLPPLQLTVKDFRYGDRAFGQLNWISSPIPHGLAIEKFTLVGKAYDLILAGQWHQRRRLSRTQVEGSLTSSDFGQTLSGWGVPDLLSWGRGRLEFKLNWLGQFQQFNTASLNGHVSVHVNRGNILKISEGTQSELGLGRVLNLFSLQTIPRRLSLDFSDLSLKGFHFRELRGEFTLRDGNAYTQNGYLDGPVAEVSLQGRVGFAKQDYDAVLMVAPHVTSSVPLIAGIFGGPIAGAAAWVGNEVFGGLIGKALGNIYSVQGKWQNPRVTKLSKSDVLATAERKSTHFTQAR